MHNWVFSHNDGDTARYTLGDLGVNNLICIGINPSTAIPNELDQTIKAVREIARLNGFDGWLMLNVYPQRDRYPENMHQNEENEIISMNQKAIKDVLAKHKFNMIWAAWGVEIERRPYLLNCLKGLIECFDETFQWVHYGALTKHGHPRHPSRMSYSEKFSTFFIKEYINR